GNEATIVSQTGGAGGILGCNTGSTAKVYMRNCYNTGDVSGLGKNENGLLSAWLGSNGAVVENCWATGTLVGAQGDDKVLARHDNATITNCYATSGTQVPLITDEEIENGALCYKINGDQTNYKWYQNLDKGTVDTHPTFDLSHNIVYAVAEKKCDGSFDPETVVYSNTDSSVIPPHQYENGFCKNCNHEDDTYPFIRVFANADHDTAGGYTNDQSADGSGLAINNSVAEHWNQQYFTSHQDLTGLQKGIYKLRVQGYSRVSQWGGTEGGIFYPNGVLEDEYAPIYHNSVFFAERNGKQIANRFMDIAEGRSETALGNGKDSEPYNEATGCYVPNALSVAHNYFLKGIYWNKPIYFAVESENDTIKVGVHNKIYQYGNWTVWDTWRLEYASEDDFELIRQQQIDEIQDELNEMDAQVSLIETYKKAQTDIKNATTLDEVLDAADVLSRTPELIRISYLAYQKYETTIEGIIADRETKELNGPYAELLDTYLYKDIETVEGLPNGTYAFILKSKTLSVEELNEEIIFVQQLYLAAQKGSINPGSDLSYLILNPGFNEDSSLKNWTRETIKTGEEGSNFSSNSGYADIYPVAGTWNTAFNVWQDLDEGLPDGIYELSAPAFHRPGGEGYDGGSIEDLSTAELFINDYYTPTLNIWEGEIDYSEAVNGVNCRYDSQYDESAPHNGENVDSYDFDTGTGYIPGSGRYCISFAFAAGRYANKAYAIVTDGKLRVGIRNT
ncbi:MAG: hypothetical protein HUK03_08935, partial [Bacteroidaceae bacterium]|nr:hypothetical protein [Bacteroidaceae bacterium]